MAIKIGQIRYSGDNSLYLTPINYTLGVLSETSVNSKTFENRIINASFSAGVSYYLRVPINRIDINTSMGDGVNENDAHRQIIDVKILNQQDNFSQTLIESYVIDPYSLGTIIPQSWNNEHNFLAWCDACITNGAININNSRYRGAQTYLDNLRQQHPASAPSNINNQGVESPTQVLELIFTPYQTCTTLLFQLRRVGFDYTSNFNRIITFDETNSLDLAIVNNILPQPADKIGIQMAPGSLVIINGEGMRVGRSGVLELNCDVAINTVGFAAPQLNIKNFILDYIYTE